MQLIERIPVYYRRQLGTLLGLLGLILIFWIMTPYFLTPSNLLNIARQTSINAIIAIGLTFVIIAGGIDLSVGSMLAFAGVVTAGALNLGIPILGSMIIGISVGFLCGAVNGVLIAWGHLPPFIATLGMMSIARGAALLFTGGRPISGFSVSFRFLAEGDFLSLPIPVYIMIGLYVVGHFVLTRTKIGRYAYAIGGNEEAAVLSGVPVKIYKLIIYGISGALSGIAAILLTARLNSAQPIAGIMYELDAIAAAVIGGTSLMGGEGLLIGTLIGALIMGVLRNGLNILGISSFIQQTIIGTVIILAVLIDMFLKRRKK